MLADRGDFLSESSMGYLPNWKPSRLTSPIGMLARAPQCFESQIPPPIEISNWELGTFIARLLLWVTFLAWYLCCYFGTFYNTAEQLFTIITYYHYQGWIQRQLCHGTTCTCTWSFLAAERAKYTRLCSAVCMLHFHTHTHMYTHTAHQPFEPYITSLASVLGGD